MSNLFCTKVFLLVWLQTELDQVVNQLEQVETKALQGQQKISSLEAQLADVNVSLLSLT